MRASEGGGDTPRAGHVLPPSQREVAASIFAAYDARRAERALDEEALLDESGEKSTGRKERGKGGKKLLREEARQNWLRRQKIMLMRSAFAPLFFRLFVLATTLVALAFAADIYGYVFVRILLLAYPNSYARLFFLQREGGRERGRESRGAREREREEE